MTLQQCVGPVFIITKAFDQIIQRGFALLIESLENLVDLNQPGRIHCFVDAIPRFI